ncbi:hypothetical protein AS590_26000 [Prescottella equi]|nr:hypothetical protein AS590_26000 [Prescottella equi]
MGWCSGEYHSPCWYKDNVIDKGLSVEEEDDLVRTAVRRMFDKYTQAKEREARMDERIRYMQTLESAIETYPIDNDWCRGRRQGIQDCIDDQTEIISELTALKTKQEVAN